jgi:hypothetical protein
MTIEAAAESPEATEEGGDTNLVLPLVQGLLSAHSDTVSQLVELSRHAGLHKLHQRLEQMVWEGYDHIGMPELFALIRQIHLELDHESDDPDD